MSLVTQNTSRICLGSQYLFLKLRKQSEANKLAFNNLKTQIANVAGLYAEEYPDLLREIDNVYRAIREITKGTPVTEPLTDSFKDAYDGNAQLTDAEKQLLKRAFKKVSSLTHPDKGGSVAQFQQANLAYENGDYQELQDMYLVLSMYPNLFWRQSEEGIRYISTEVNRPRANTQKLRAAPIFKAVQHHIQGNKVAASAIVQDVLVRQLAQLVAELNHLRRKQHHG